MRGQRRLLLASCKEDNAITHWEMRRYARTKGYRAKQSMWVLLVMLLFLGMACFTPVGAVGIYTGSTDLRVWGSGGQQQSGLVPPPDLIGAAANSYLAYAMAQGQGAGFRSHGGKLFA